MRILFTVFIIAVVFYSFFPLVSSQISVQRDWRDLSPCMDGETQICGSNVGACISGHRTCSAGSWRPCDAGEYPKPEICGNNIDDDCNGLTDECVDAVSYALVILGVIIFIFVWVLAKI